MEKNIQISREYSNFLDTRLLWIASHEPFNREILQQEWTSLQQHLSPSKLAEWWRGTLHSLTSDPIGWILATIIIVTLLSFRSKWRRCSTSYHTQARDANCQSIKPTLLGLLSEIGIVLPAFLLLISLGLVSCIDKCYAEGLLGGASVYFLFHTTIRLSRKDGFLVSNFKIGETRCSTLNHICKWNIPVLLPVWIIHKILSYHASVEQGGRIFTVIVLLLIALILHHVLKPKNQMFAVKGKATLRSYLIYSICVITPMIFILATALGYYTTTLLLQTQFIYSIRLVMGVLLASAILKRWLLVSRRSFAEKSFRKEQSKENLATEGNEKLSEREIRKQIVSKITEVSDQSRKLLSVAQVVIITLSLIGIWANTLPALKVLDEVQLWTTAIPDGSSSATHLGSTKCHKNLQFPTYWIPLGHPSEPAQYVPHFHPCLHRS